MKMRVIIDFFSTEPKGRFLMGHIDNVPQKGNLIQSSKFPNMVFRIVGVKYILEDDSEGRPGLTAIVEAYDENLLGS
jgi:hypothetical protein